MDLLGETIEKIAVEKAGIIKSEIPVIISETQGETKNVFINKALQCGSSLFFADKIFSCDLKLNENESTERNFLMTELLTNQQWEGRTVLGGDYQSKNLQAVFASFKVLKGTFNFSDENINDGIRKVVINTGFQGRWQILSTAPLTICDTGHNKEGLEYVLEQIKNTEKSMLHIILGFVNDKDLSKVLPLFPQDATYYFTKASVPRALDENILSADASRIGLIGDSFNNVPDAVRSAMKHADKSDLIFIGGSTFIVADALQIF